MSKSEAERLLESSFATLDDARRFIEWYEQAEHVTDWDRTRAQQAAELLGVRRVTITPEGE